MSSSENICPGYTRVAENVLVEIAENAVNDIEGVSIADEINGGSVVLRIRGGVAEFTVPIEIAYGYKTDQCISQVQSEIKNSIQGMTGIAVSKVNVLVQRVSSN